MDTDGLAVETAATLMEAGLSSGQRSMESSGLVRFGGRFGNGRLRFLIHVERRANIDPT